MSDLFWIRTAMVMAFLTACALGTASLCFLNGLPTGMEIPLWSGNVHWSSSRANNVVVSLAVFLLTFATVSLLGWAIAVVWHGMEAVAAFLLGVTNLPRPPSLSDQRSRTGVAAGLALTLGAACFSGVVQNGIAVVAVVIVYLIVTTALVLRRAFPEGSPKDPVTLRSRTSAIGGGQTEWHIPARLLLLLLAAVLAGGTVTLAALTLPRSPKTDTETKGSGAPHSTEKPAPSAGAER